MQKVVYDHIPGLFVYLDCFSKSDCEALLRGSLDFYERLEAASAALSARPREGSWCRGKPSTLPQSSFQYERV